MEYHLPVLAKESIDALEIKEDGVYVDATFGGGGHSRLILERLGDNGRLFGFDQDEDAHNNALEDERFTLIPHNFRHLKRFLRVHGVKKVDGILGDLGVSSHQLDVPERGFSFRFQSDLDMRMNQLDELTASKVLNTYTAGDLQNLFSRFGEVRNAKTLAHKITTERNLQTIQTVNDFLQIIAPIIRGQRNKYLAQVFQALRMEVNDEVGALVDLLSQCIEMLKTDGLMVMISYHSIEDRLVKDFLRFGNAEGKAIKDFYGNIYRPFKILTKKAFLPSEEEIKVNPRARSAKMRVGRRTDEEAFQEEE
ncbi:MAG: 16S rRNA (cytosine(1402)-N(4))-methyltransferase RsmH [Saprospiraceae bacterium]|jgi:16S rRNA (cytosine1402-N4)-methyltransferase|nr:16S rRNA (cytosine(1402)-N(4))-methyltransferase RsmH [Saprospiraceae bacterium]